jgi:alanine-synthesizing transaminase
VVAPQPNFRRIERLPPYVFNIVNELKAAARARGEDIIDFGMGNPGPADAAAHRRQAGRGVPAPRYPPLLGLPRHPAAAPGDLPLVSGSLRRQLDPDSEAIVTIGSKEGLAHLALATMGAGDTVLVPNPAYPIHPYGFIIAGADVRHVRLTPEVDFFEELQARHPRLLAAAEDAGAELSRQPDHPVRRAGLLRAVVEIAREHGIWVVHDLAYADIVFDGYKAPSILQVPGAKDIAVEFFSMSKSYNMPGWRIGFMCGNPTLVAALARIKSYLDYGTFTPIQVAAIHALESTQDCVAEIRDMYQSRRDCASATA